MIKGIGIDLVENNRIEFLLNKYGLKFAKKILSNEEMNDFLSSTSQSRFLSKNFASKEALSKALGTGLYREG
ncbi:MAG: holo-[acyl-carrier-protein] synthase, partial [Gammaproteobacteria bacterium]|nr:holo-[acyl-carrier-protein] synthase [Gammaproteobacteria bacterium]